MASPTEDRLRDIVADVFGVSVETINEDSNPDTIDTWDSVAHINLILSLEEELAVTLSPEDAMEMLSVRLIRTILNKHGITIPK